MQNGPSGVCFGNFLIVHVGPEERFRSSALRSRRSKCGIRAPERKERLASAIKCSYIALLFIPMHSISSPRLNESCCYIGAIVTHIFSSCCLSDSLKRLFLDLCSQYFSSLLQRTGSGRVTYQRAHRRTDGIVAVAGSLAVELPATRGPLPCQVQSNCMRKPLPSKERD